MIPVFRCGSCGKHTQMYPKGSPIMEEVTEYIPVEIKEIVDNKVQVRIDTVARTRLQQKVKQIRRQNVFTGEIELVPIGLEDLGDSEKTIQIQLRIGDETMTKAVCSSCYENIKETAENLFTVLSNLKSF